jgi:hypothetical protein
MDYSERYPYIEAEDASGINLLRPLMPITLQNENISKSLLGLLDTGASVSVLPYQIGIELGFSWSQQTPSINLVGNLGGYEAKGVIVMGHVGNLPSVPLTFAWTRAENVRILLGQVNFFREFDVCFFESRRMFEVSTRR